MPATKKIEQVEDLERFLEGASIVIGTNFRGLTVPQIEGLRKALRQSDAQYRVIKNRLAVRAAENKGQGGLREVLQGSVGLVITRGDPAPAARALTTYIRTNRMTLPLTGALMNERFLTSSEVESLANLPPREVLLAQLLGGLNAAARGLVGVLHARLSSIVNVLEQRRRQLEEKG